MPLLQDIAHGLAHVLFPRLCEGCRTPLIPQEYTLCLTCLFELPKTGYHSIADNEAALRFAGRIPYQQVTALSHFTEDSLIAHLMHRLKYKNRKEIGLFLGRQLGHELLKSDWMKTVDLLIPVPLHPKKEAMRSYNQSALLCKGIGEITGTEVTTKNLSRIKFTESQTLKTREERVRNVKDAFVAKNEEALKGCHVLLVDDVLTTGATLEAAANALLVIPQLKISIATAALANS